MATRDLLAEITGHGAEGILANLDIESAGGLDVARRIREGEVADIVILASGAIAALEAEGLVTDPTPFVVSEVVLAVPTGSPKPDISTEAALRETLEAVGPIGYSTGPSGDAFLALLDRWDLRDTLSDRLVQAPVGVSVGRLLTEGTVVIGLQQRPELTGIEGVDIHGPLPHECAIRTTFTAAILKTSAGPDAARNALCALKSPTLRGAIQRHGLNTASP